VSRFLILALFLCALVVPRAAWAEHVGQHGQSLASSEEHIHHDDHVHTVAASEAGHEHDSSLDDHSEHGSNPAHNHLPADVLSIGAEPESAPLLNNRIMLAERQSAAPRAQGAPKSPPSSLLRPPRTV
jgi:hypothetical protein